MNTGMKENNAIRPNSRAVLINQWYAYHWRYEEGYLVVREDIGL
jgi:hypothetical protein